MTNKRLVTHPQRGSAPTGPVLVLNDGMEPTERREMVEEVIWAGGGLVVEGFVSEEQDFGLNILWDMK